MKDDIMTFLKTILLFCLFPILVISIGCIVSCLPRCSSQPMNRVMTMEDKLEKCMADNDMLKKKLLDLEAAAATHDKHSTCRRSSMNRRMLKMELRIAELELKVRELENGLQNGRERDPGMAP